MPTKICRKLKVTTSVLSEEGSSNYPSIWVAAKLKRESRQHGMVRTYRILPSPLNSRPESRFVNRFDSPPTAGLFTKVSTKPTNHSKFTGKCGKPKCSGCHVHPACKSKDKGKGTQKQRSAAVEAACDGVGVWNYKSIAWRVVDGRPGLSFVGASATGILDHLSANDYMEDDDVDDDYEGESDCVGEVYEGSCGLVVDDGLIVAESSGVDVIKGPDHGSRVYDDNNDDNDDDDDDRMSFCEVGFVWDQVDDDGGWCVVGEM